MTIFAVLVTMASTLIAGTDRVFESPALDLAFTHSSSWKVSKTRVGTTFSIPIGRSTSHASVELLDAVYHDSADRWQESQAKVSEAMKRKVDRQWQEEILGVPMLMTKLTYASKGVEVSSLVGLLYSATPKKLQFRLVAPVDAYDAVEREWRDAMLTLKTLSGELPKPEDPNRVIPPTTKATKAKPEEKPTDRVVRPRTPVRLEPPWKTSGRKSRAKVQVPLKAGGKEVVLFLPEGWSFTPAGERIALRRAGLKGEATIEPLSKLDSPAPERKLVLSTGSTLDDFVSVKLRDESLPFLNRAGAKVLVATRDGKGADGELFELHATGELGDFYWLLYYRAKGSGVYAADRKAIEDLIQSASLELKP